MGLNVIFLPWRDSSKIFSFLLLKNLQGEWPPATDPWLTVLVWDYKTLIACLAPDHENTPVLPGHWIQSCVRPGALWVTNHNEKASLPSLTDVHSMFAILSLPWIWRARKDWRCRNLNRGCAASFCLHCLAGVSFLPWENRSGTEQKLRS